DLDTAVINVTFNSAPTITAQADTSLFLCTPTPVCIGYDVSDPDGLSGLVEDMGAGFGTIDTLNNQICFTPDVSGNYEFIVEVTDPCGETDADTVVVSITFGQFAAIDCPTEPIDVFLCAADEICQMVDVTPASASVSVSFGSYANGEVCFTADTAGIYEIEMIATESCNADTCLITFNVEIGQAAQIDCPAAASKFLCQASDVCVPVGIQGSGVSVAVSPVGSYSAGSVCFPADTSGHYEIEIIATTDCGIDTCILVRDVTINSAPIAVDPPSPIDTFMCATGQVCYQFEASDADAETLIFEKLSGDGTVTSNGLWCFNVSRIVTKTVTAQVSDGCGAADTVSLTYNIELNSAPIVTLGNDTSIFICSGAS
ncbi:MAG TPA: hypothetical protein PLF13_01355, partial [candidate division Zixibacteria bacterium]|nr:hypothetical protein [candidate division Zixibacteria bacterium]